MKRSSPLRPGKPLVRKSRLKSGGRLKVKGKRRFKGTEDRAFLAWIRQQPCVISGRITGQTFWRDGVALGPARIESTHVRTKAQGLPDVGNVVPMDFRLHREEHVVGIVTFQKRHNIDLAAEATRLAAAYLNEQGET